MADPVRPLRAGLLGIALVSQLAAAAEEPPSHCTPPPGWSLPSVPDSPQSVSTVTLEADSAVVSSREEWLLRGNVRIQRGGRTLHAEEARYDKSTDEVRATGPLEYRDDTVAISAGSATFDSENNSGTLLDTRFRLNGLDARGTAGEITASGDRTLTLRDVTYTSCPPGRSDWELIAPQLKLDSAAGTVSGRNVRVSFKGVPFIWIPYASFPVTDQRKSGFLTPDLSSSNRSGSAIRFPYYWNIAPHMDLTFTPRLLTDRGWQTTADFRYLTRRGGGEIGVEFLPDDSLTGRDRGFVHVANTTRLSERWRFDTSLSDASDSEYFEDLGSTLTDASRLYLDRVLEFHYRRPAWTFAGRAQNLQTIDDEIDRGDRPYRRLPQLLFGGSWPVGNGRLHASFDAELVNFQRPDLSTTGARMDLAPRISLPWRHDGWHITPELGWRYTRYELSGLPPGSDTAPSRSAPVFSLDAGMALERLAGPDNGLLHTLEPTMRYTWIPFREQSELPVFDSGPADFNFVQLFSDYRFNGADRLGDANHVSIGVTSRVLNLATGQQFLKATLGERVYFDNRDVTLPGGEIQTATGSDVLAEVDVTISTRWRAGIDFQWDPSARSPTKSAARLEWRPGSRSALKFGYRFLDNQVEQTDIAFALPLGSRWRSVGRWNFSLPENRTLDQLFGLEYERCCWAIQIASRRFLTTRDGEFDNTLYLQLELKGLTSVGRRADALLDRGILAY